MKMVVYLLLYPRHIPPGYHLIATEAIQGLYATPIRFPCREYQADATLAFFGSRKTDAKCRKSRFGIVACFFVWNTTFFTSIIIKDIKIILMVGLRASMTMYSARYHGFYGICGRLSGSEKIIVPKGFLPIRTSPCIRRMLLILFPSADNSRKMPWMPKEAIQKEDVELTGLKNRISWNGNWRMRWPKQRGDDNDDRCDDFPKVQGL